MAPGRRQLQKIQFGKEMIANGTPATFYTVARVGFGGLLNDERSVNTVDEMLGLIPGQTRSYVSSATGSVAMGGTPLNPQYLPIHTANCVTGVTAGALSSAAKAILDTVGNTGTGLKYTAGSRAFTVTTGSPPTGAAVYDKSTTPYTYVGTVGSSLTFVNYSANGTSSSGVAYGWIPEASKNTVGYSYNVTLPTTEFPTPNTSYTIQAGDDFEQEVMKYAKCTGFSAQGGAGGTLDMQASYMGQAVQLGYVGPGTITVALGNTAVSGSGTDFVATALSSDVGRKLYTLDNVLIGEISAVGGGGVTLKAGSTVALTNSQYRIGGFSSSTAYSAKPDDLIFARTRLFIDDVQAWPVARPTPVVYQFLAFSAQLQCTWATKFTGEGYQGIDPTWAFALLTNYQVGGDFTVEHDKIASGKYSASSIESLKYAWRNLVPKIIQIDCPSSTQVNWHTVSASPTVQTLTYSLPALEAGTISIDATDLLTVTGVGTTFTPYAGKKLCVFVNGSYYYVGNVASVGGTGTLTLSENLYGVIPAGSSFTVDGTKITAGGGTPFTGTAGNDVFKDSTTWIGRIANVESGTVAHTYVSSAIGAFTVLDVPTFILESCTQPYFPVVGQGPLKTYTGIQFRVPVQIMSVSGVNDNDGNDIVTVTWQQRYNPTVANGGDIRIVNQLPSLAVAN